MSYFIWTLASIGLEIVLLASVMSIFRRPVQRLATLAGGGHACTTYVPHAPTQEGSPG